MNFEFIFATTLIYYFIKIIFLLIFLKILSTDFVIIKINKNL